jgi:hypothetical protein
VLVCNSFTRAGPVCLCSGDQDTHPCDNLSLMLCMQQVSSEQQAPGSNREVEEAASAVAKGKHTLCYF